MAPYTHFKNKSELYKAVATCGFEALGLRMEQVQKEATSANELIMAYGAEYIDFAIGNPQMYRLMLSQTNSGKQLDGKNIKPDDVQSKLQLASQRPYVLLRDCFSRSEKDQKKLRMRALGAWALVHGIAALILEGHIEIDEGMSTKQFLAEVGPRMR
jgi:AcrR family transcriptional regulator